MQPPKGIATYVLVNSLAPPSGFAVNVVLSVAISATTTILNYVLTATLKPDGLTNMRTRSSTRIRLQILSQMGLYTTSVLAVPKTLARMLASHNQRALTLTPTNTNSNKRLTALMCPSTRPLIIHIVIARVRRWRRQRNVYRCAQEPGWWLTPGRPAHRRSSRQV